MGKRTALEGNDEGSMVKLLIFHNLIQKAASELRK